jgi:exonuclease III
MDLTTQRRSWNILCWNVRGLNAESKWVSIRDRIIESKSDIISIQETKGEDFDINYIRKFCPGILMTFVSFPQLGHQGEFLWFGKAQYSLALKFFRTVMQSQCLSLLLIMMTVGCLLLFMDHVILMEKSISSTGWRISRCLMMPIGC